MIHQATARLAAIQQAHGDALLSVLTGLLALLLFVLVPLDPLGFHVFQVLSGLVLVAIAVCALLASGSLIAFGIIVAGIVVNLVAVLLRLHAPDRFGIALLALAWFLISATLIKVVAGLVFGPGRVSYHRIVGAVLLYLLAASLFVAVYAMLGTFVSAAFKGLTFEDSPALGSDLVYFSFVTLTSIGFGDVVPVHPLARSLCNVETIIGQLYPATLLARLVTLELAHRG